MEILFRRHFWVFHAAFLALTAFLLARAVNVGLERALQGTLQTEDEARPTERAAPPAPVRNFDAANDANIFGAKREVLSPEAPTTGTCRTDADCGDRLCKDGVCVDRGDPKNDLASAEPSELRARLVGTAVFSEPTYSLASIVDESGGKGSEAELYSINPCASVPPPPAEGEVSLEGPPTSEPCNQLLDVAEIRLIDADRVYFYNRSQERFEYLALGEEPKKGGATVAKAPPPKQQKGQSKSGKNDDLEQHIKKTGDTSWSVEQAGIDKALGDLSSLATQARIVPAFEGGEAVGFKLFSIRPGSLYSKIGIQNGDVISRINGYEINSPDKALEIYQKLKDAKEITVDMKRRGKPVTLNYNVVP